MRDDADVIRTSLMWIAEYTRRAPACAYPLFHSRHCPVNINIHRKPRMDGVNKTAAALAVTFKGKQILCAASSGGVDEDGLKQSLSKYLVPDGRFTTTGPPPPPYSFPFVIKDSYGACAVWYEQSAAVKEGEKPLFVACGVGVVTGLKFPHFDVVKKIVSDAYEAAQKAASKEGDDWATVAFLQSKVLDPLDMRAEKVIETPSPASMKKVSQILRIMSLDHILTLLCCMVMEHKILLVSSSYSTLTMVAETFRQLLAPLSWCHVYVPVLPRSLLEHLQCPTPFLIGIHSSYAYKQDFPFAIDLTVIDLDADSVTLPPRMVETVRWAPPRAASQTSRYLLTSIRKPLDALYPFSANADES